MQKTIHALVALAALLIATPLEAHFVWMRIDIADEQPTAHLFFSEAGHVDGNRLPDSIQAAEASVHTAGSDAKSLSLSDSEVDDFISRAATLNSGSTTAVFTDCEYGLYHGMLLQYYAKAIHLGDPAELDQVNKWAGAKLDIIPSLAPGKLIVGVAWEGQPVEGADVQIVDPHGNEHDLVTDAQGSLDFEGLKEGLYCVRTNRSDKSATGNVDGEDYKGASYYATLTIRIPASLAGGEPGQVSGVELESAYPQLPIGISSFGAAVNGDYLYVYSGHTGRAHAHSKDNLSEHFCRINLRQADATWEPLPMPRPLQGLAMVAHGDHVYRIGGLEALNAADDDELLQSVADFERFDVNRKQWESLPDLPQPRSSHDAIVVGDKLYVVGGWTLSTEGDEEWLYNGLMMDLSADKLTWTEFEVPFERRALAAGTHDGLIYAMGGLTSLGEIDRTVSVYDPATGNHFEGPELPGSGMDGFGISAWQLDGRLFVSGVSGTVLELDTAANEWKEAGQLKQGRFFHRLLPDHEGALLAVAGASMRGHLTNIEKIDFEN
ncbi:MAG: hypothetical protein AAGF97_02150 [Planctomycetota bacterium]